MLAIPATIRRKKSHRWRTRWLSRRSQTHPSAALSNYCERLLPDVAIGDNVVRAVQIEFVDLFLRHELIDLDRAFAFDRDRLEFLGIDLEVLVLTDLVAFDDVIGVDFFFAVGIDLAVFDPMTGLFVDLMEADFFALRRRGEERDRTRDQRQLEVALPIRAGCHD